MTTIFEYLKGFSMKGEDFELELAMLIHDAEIEVEISRYLGESTSFAKEVSRLLNIEGRNKNHSKVEIWDGGSPELPWEERFGVVYDDEIPF